MTEAEQLMARIGQAPKLTDWKNEPSAETLSKDVDNARPQQREHAARIRKWLNLRDVKGEAKPEKIKGRSSIQPKLVRRQAEWRYSALTEPFLGSNKLFKVSPSTYADVEAARQNGILLNWQFRTKMNRVSFIDNFVRAVVDEGTAILKVSWVRVTKTIKVQKPVVELFPITSADQLNDFQMALQMVNEDPAQMEKLPVEMQEALNYYQETQEPTVGVVTGSQEVDEEQVVENRPKVELLNPMNVYVDPTCNGEIDNALFIAYSFETNKATLEKEKGRYKNLDRVDWESASVGSDGEHTSPIHGETTFTDAPRKKVVAYEYWGFYDVHGTGELVPIVATWIGKTLIRLEENPFPDRKIPFILVPYLPVARGIFGEPDAELLEDNQKVLGATIRGMVDLLGRSANGQQGFAKGMLDVLNRRRYDNGQDYEFNPTMNPANGIIEHRFPEIPQSALTMLALQNQEAEALTGVKSFAGGVSGEAYGDVAAGIRGMLDAASKREMAILRRLAQGITELGRKVIAMNGTYLTEKEVVQITDEQFVEIHPESLAGEFDLEVDISTAEVDNAKSQDLGFMLQTLGPNMDPQITMMLLAEIADLKRMPALSHTLRNWKPTPDPVQEQIKQLELQKLQAELEKTQSEARYSDARAKLALAEVDKLNLDYVEQETGTKHARDMEKQSGQAKGNQSLEITKAMTRPRKEGEKEPDIAAAVGFNALGDRLNNAQPVMPQRAMAGQPRPAGSEFNIGSKYFDPASDPALNPRINL